MITCPVIPPPLKLVGIGLVAVAASIVIIDWVIQKCRGKSTTTTSYPATGTCTYEEWKPLRDQQAKWCRNYGCEASDDCPTILRKMAIIEACMQARWNLSRTCFGGFDIIHDDEAMRLSYAVSKCLHIAKMEHKKCIERIGPTDPWATNEWKQIYGNIVRD